MPLTFKRPERRSVEVIRAVHASVGRPTSILGLWSVEVVRTDHAPVGRPTSILGLFPTRTSKSRGGDTSALETIIGHTLKNIQTCSGNERAVHPRCRQK